MIPFVWSRDKIIYIFCHHSQGHSIPVVQVDSTFEVTFEDMHLQQSYCYLCIVITLRLLVQTGEVGRQVEGTHSELLEYSNNELNLAERFRSRSLEALHKISTFFSSFFWGGFCVYFDGLLLNLVSYNSTFKLYSRGSTVVTLSHTHCASSSGQTRRS